VTSAVSARVAELAAAGTAAVSAAKLKLATAVLLSLLVAGAGVLAGMAPTGAEQPAAVSHETSVGRPEGKPPVAPAPAPRAPNRRSRTDLLLDPDGRPDAPVRNAADWAKRRARILANMQLVLGPLPDASTRVPVDLRIEGVEDLGQVVRKKISLAVARGERVSGYLLLPKALKGKAPGILCPHQTNNPLGSKEPAGLGGLENQQCAKHLAERGFVCLAIDYPGFGAYRPFDLQKTGFQSGMMKAVWNNGRAIDALESLAEVDPARIGCIGHSLGGHTTLFTAAFDERIGAVVSNCGFTSFPKYHGGDLKGWTGPLMMPRIATVYGSDPARVPFDFPEVVAALAPRPFLTISPTRDDFDVDGVKDCVAAAGRVYQLLGVPERLSASYPAYGHHFAAAGRRTAYAFLERWLKRGK
jgi:dienelactone hydrolase